MLPNQNTRKFSLILFIGLLLTGNLGAQELVDSIVTYYYPEIGDSIHGVKIATDYNGALQKTAYSIYLWNTNTRRWDGWSFPCEECAYGLGRYEYGYDEKGNQVSTGGFEWWGQTTGWLQRTRSTSVYDNRGNKVSLIYYGWNTTKTDWIPSMRQEFEYDDHGRSTSHILYNWNPDVNTWLPWDKMMYFFDGHGRKRVELRQDWDETTGDWVNLTKTEWLFDSLGIKTEYASFGWTLTGKNYDWMENQRKMIENVFDSAGNRILTTESVKASPTRWTPIYKEEMTYNQIGKPVLSVISKGSGSLTEYFRTAWDYDHEGRLATETLIGPMQRMPGLMVKKKLMVIRSFNYEGDIVREIWHYWDIVTKSYIFSSKDYYFYHSIPTGKKEIVIDHIRIYPNPTLGIVYLTGLSQPAEVKIYSLQGVLLRWMHQVENSADLTGLSPGAYLIQVSQEGRPPFQTILIRE